jgi:hypothetical protein
MSREEKLKKGCGNIFDLDDEDGHQVGCSKLEGLCPICSAELKGIQEGRAEERKELKKSINNFKNGLFAIGKYNQNHQESYKDFASISQIIKVIDKEILGEADTK